MKNSKRKRRRDRHKPNPQVVRKFNPLDIKIKINVSAQEIEKVRSSISTIMQHAVSAVGTIANVKIPRADMAIPGSDRAVIVKWDLENMTAVTMEMRQEGLTKAKLLETREYLRSQQSLEEEQKLHCQSCKFFYGRRDRGNYLHCAPHPHKPENTLECGDFETGFSPEPEIYPCHTQQESANELISRNLKKICRATEQDRLCKALGRYGPFRSDFEVKPSDASGSHGDACPTST